MDDRTKALEFLDNLDRPISIKQIEKQKTEDVAPKPPAEPCSKPIEKPQKSYRKIKTIAVAINLGVLLTLGSVYCMSSLLQKYEKDTAIIDKIKVVMDNATLDYNISYGSLLTYYGGNWTMVQIRAEYPREPWKTTSGELWFNTGTNEYHIILEP